jgi:hypothetical protein
MKISGFSMVRNATKLYYPVKQSVMSALPLVDEFIIALGNGEPDDNTENEIKSINSDKVKIINTVWDLEKYPRGMEHAHQTDIAKEACSGDWLIYLQADEVIHEKYLDIVYKNCEKYLNNELVEGFLFRYKHFWGDYSHYHISHAWYPKEIRVIRNKKEIHSWISAQSFRRIPDFDGLSYRKKEGSFKLNVVKIDAEIYHYGWVRPPEYMRTKIKYLSTNHWGIKRGQEEYDKLSKGFDYGPLNKIAKFTETHPEVMKDWIEKFNWADKLQYSGTSNKFRHKHRHELFKYRFLTFVEQNLMFGNQLFGNKNYNILKANQL